MTPLPSSGPHRPHGKIRARFGGRFDVKLDPKGRLSLPAAFRQVLPSSASSSDSGSDSDSSGNTQVVVTNSRYRGKSCLHVYTLGEWEKLERRISRLSSLRAEVEAFSRFYLSGGQAVEVDAQGRILVPQSLRRFAGLETQVVLVGLGGKFEVWSLETWSEIYSDLTENFEATLAAVASLEGEEEKGKGDPDGGREGGRDGDEGGDE